MAGKAPRRVGEAGRGPEARRLGVHLGRDGPRVAYCSEDENVNRWFGSGPSRSCQAGCGSRGAPSSSAVLVTATFSLPTESYHVSLEGWKSTCRPGSEPNAAAQGPVPRCSLQALRSSGPGWGPRVPQSPLHPRDQPRASEAMSSREPRSSPWPTRAPRGQPVSRTLSGGRWAGTLRPAPSSSGSRS